ncbi:MAG: phage holin family protein [Chloroflexi bacterium]|nr:phage holin family protein [Chloroflexota bacterium]
MALIIRWAVLFAAILVTGFIAPQFFGYDDLASAAIFAAILGLVNAIIRPIVALLALPITCLTLGLFSLVINGLMFWLATALFPRVHVSGFLGAIVAALIVSVVSWVLNHFVRSE